MPTAASRAMACRGPDDVAFRTPAVAAGETISLERELTPEPDSPVAYVPELLSVICQ